MVHLACSYWKSLILSNDVLRVTILKQTPFSRSSTVDCNNEAVEQIPLAMITMRKSIHGFPFLSYMGMGIRLAALRAFGAPLLVVQRFECFAMEYPTYVYESLVSSRYTEETSYTMRKRCIAFYTMSCHAIENTVSNTINEAQYMKAGCNIYILYCESCFLIGSISYGVP